jgi:hypothetical protein
MGRSLFSLGTWRPVLATLVASVFLLGTAGTAAAESAQDKAFTQLRGAYSFGMTKDEVVKVLKKQVYERFGPQIQATRDIALQDKLRRKRKREIRRIEKSFVQFTGKKTGWDVSIIDDQFRHGTDESMMVYWENYQGKNQRRFFFFHDGRLYKMFIALNTDAMGGAGKTFAHYQGILEKRFGGGKVGFRTDKDGTEWPSYIEWKSKKYKVRALDKLSFYGAFCIWIAEPGMLAAVHQVRADRAPPPEEKNKVIKSITAEGDEDPSLNEGAGTIDSILKGD